MEQSRKELQDTIRGHLLHSLSKEGVNLEFLDWIIAYHHFDIKPHESAKILNQSEIEGMDKKYEKILSNSEVPSFIKSSIENTYGIMRVSNIPNFNNNFDDYYGYSHTFIHIPALTNIINPKYIINPNLGGKELALVLNFLAMPLALGPSWVPYLGAGLSSAGLLVGYYDDKASEKTTVDKQTLDLWIKKIDYINELQRNGKLSSLSDIWDKLLIKHPVLQNGDVDTGLEKMLALLEQSNGNDLIEVAFAKMVNCLIQNCDDQQQLELNQQELDEKLQKFIEKTGLDLTKLKQEATNAVKLWQFFIINEERKQREKQQIKQFNQLVKDVENSFIIAAGLLDWFFKDTSLTEQFKVYTHSLLQVGSIVVGMCLGQIIPNTSGMLALASTAVQAIQRIAAFHNPAFTQADRMEKRIKELTHLVEIGFSCFFQEQQAVKDQLIKGFADLAAGQKDIGVQISTIQSELNRFVQAYDQTEQEKVMDKLNLTLTKLNVLKKPIIGEYQQVKYHNYLNQFYHHANHSAKNRILSGYAPKARTIQELLIELKYRPGSIASIYGLLPSIAHQLAHQAREATIDTSSITFPANQMRSNPWEWRKGALTFLAIRQNALYLPAQANMQETLDSLIQEGKAIETITKHLGSRELIKLTDELLDETVKELQQILADEGNRLTKRLLTEWLEHYNEGKRAEERLTLCEFICGCPLMIGVNGRHVIKKSSEDKTKPLEVLDEGFTYKDKVEQNFLYQWSKSQVADPITQAERRGLIQIQERNSKLKFNSNLLENSHLMPLIRLMVPLNKCEYIYTSLGHKMEWQYYVYEFFKGKSFIESYRSFPNEVKGLFSRQIQTKYKDQIGNGDVDLTKVGLNRTGVGNNPWINNPEHEKVTFIDFLIFQLNDYFVLLKQRHYERYTSELNNLIKRWLMTNERFSELATLLAFQITARRIWVDLYFWQVSCNASSIPIVEPVSAEKILADLATAIAKLIADENVFNPKRYYASYEQKVEDLFISEFGAKLKERIKSFVQTEKDRTEELLKKHEPNGHLPIVSEVIDLLEQHQHLEKQIMRPHEQSQPEQNLQTKLMFAQGLFKKAESASRNMRTIAVQAEECINSLLRELPEEKTDTNFVEAKLLQGHIAFLLNKYHFALTCYQECYAYMADTHSKKAYVELTISGLCSMLGP